MKLVLGRMVKHVDRKMCFNVKQCMVCINKLDLVDYALLFGTLLFKGQINIQINCFLIDDIVTDSHIHRY